MLVVRFIYAMYFTKGIAANENLGTEQGAIAVTITAVIVAVMSPYLGAIADRAAMDSMLILRTTLAFFLTSHLAGCSTLHPEIIQDPVAAEALWSLT